MLGLGRFTNNFLLEQQIQQMCKRKKTDRRGLMDGVGPAYNTLLESHREGPHCNILS